MKKVFLIFSFVILCSITFVHAGNCWLDDCKADYTLQDCQNEDGTWFGGYDCDKLGCCFITTGNIPNCHESFTVELCKEADSSSFFFLGECSQYHKCQPEVLNLVTDDTDTDSDASVPSAPWGIVVFLLVVFCLLIILFAFIRKTF